MHVRTIPLPGFIRRSLPGQAFDWGPPRREQWLGEYQREHPRDWSVAFPAEPIPEPPLDASGSTVVFPRLPREFHPVGTMRLRDAWLLGSNGFIVDAAGVYLIDSNMWFPDYRNTPVFGLMKRLATGHLPGRTVSFLSLWASHNYCHFLLEAIPRVAVFLAAGHTWADVDHVLVPQFFGPSARWVRDRLPIPPEKIRHVEFGEYLQCNELLATSHPGSPRIIPRWAAAFLRELGGGDARRGDRRVFIPRRATRRRMVNETAIEEMLVQEFGFEVLADADDTDEIATMQEAALVVGPHGAGLSRIAFCRPGAQIIELLSPAWIEPYYWSLARAGNRTYTPIVGTNERPRRKIIFSHSGVETDFTVDADAVRQAVHAALLRA